MSADALKHNHQPAESAPRWYKLDNAARIYPAIRSRRWSSVFRLSVTLTEPVQPVLLQQALGITLRRMPVFAVKMKRGLFWHYFEHGRDKPLVEQDVADPCVAMASGSQDYLFRVRYYDRRIAVEFFHSLTDGSGGLVFLKTLTAEYLKLCGYAIPATHGILDTSADPKAEEAEDSFFRYANLNMLASRKEARAYHVPGTRLPPHRVNVVTGRIPVDRVLAEAKKRGATLTEYLAGAYLYVLFTIQKAEGKRLRKPVKLSIPVNLRRFFGSETLRNFSSYVNASIDGRYGDYTFDEVVKHVHHFLRLEVTDKLLNARLASNVKAQMNPFLRATPLFVKNWALFMVFQFVGEAIFTSTMTNLGAIDVPEEMKPHIQHFDFMLGPPRTNRIGCAVASYGGTLSINFTRTIHEAFVEREFFTFLVRQGIPVKISSNQE